MPFDDDAAYLALRTRDARFDGRLFVGVSSTGVYCRPVCRVRVPLRRNCHFFANAASAEREGFRPCLRCRPELAPGLSLVDSSHALAWQAARMIEQGTRDGSVLSVDRLAARLGITDRHLRRIFRRAHGVTPVAYLATQRLLLAKQLLTDTALPVTQVAMASGFASLRRFNALFAERYRMNPSRLRTASGEAALSNPIPTLRVTYRPPYDIEGVLRFLAQRAMPGVEKIDGLQWHRTLAVTQGASLHRGWLSCRFDAARHEVQVTVAPTLLPVLGVLLLRLRQALDLDADPGPIDACLQCLPVPPRPGIRVPGALDGFETAVRIVLGQQITVAAARTLAARLIDTLGEPVATPFADLRRLFPTADAIATADPERIGKLGIVRQRVRALQALAAETAAGRIMLHPAAPLQPTLQALRALPGIGEWTVQLIAMRVLSWPDAFAATDIGLLNALGTRDVRAATELAETWRPWRAYALMRLWQTLERAA